LLQKFQVALDLGGSKIYTLLAQNETIITSVRTKTPQQGDPETLLPFLAACVSDILHEGEVPPESLSAVGLCVAGFFDSRERVLVSAPNLSGWDRVPLEAELSGMLGVPVLVENDANAAALAETRYGAGRGCNDMVYVTVSTGVGAGIISGGRIFRGSRGLAGEIGHMIVAPEGPFCGCGKRGCLESVASGTAISRLAEEKARSEEGGLMASLAGGAENITAHHVFVAASRGDKTAQGILDTVFHYLGLGLANAVNILNPQALIIGGGVSEAGEALLSPLRSKVKKMAGSAAAAELIFRKAELGVASGARGMLALLNE